MDQPTIAEIDEALTYLRQTFYSVDGDDVKQAFVLRCIDELLEQRQAMCATV